MWSNQRLMRVEMVGYLGIEVGDRGGEVSGGSKVRWDLGKGIVKKGILRVYPGESGRDSGEG